MDPRTLLDRLIAYEHRVYRMYRTLGDRADFPVELRYLWNTLAEDERHHLVILERSAGLLDMMDSPPVVSEEILAEIEVKVTTAEVALQCADLGTDEALCQALILEGSELNSLDEAWFQGFRPALGGLLRAMIPAEDIHIRRLVEGVHTFSLDKTLHHRAVTLWMMYQSDQQRCTNFTTSA
jgi:hypothetical protein